MDASVHSMQAILMDPHNSGSSKKGKSLLTFSIFNVVFGVLSCSLMITIMVLYMDRGSLDIIGYGIWSGVLYLIIGTLGWIASCKGTRSVFVATLVLSIFGMLMAIAVVSLSVVMGLLVELFSGCYYYEDGYYNDSECKVWRILEFVLAGVNFLAWVNNIVIIVLTSKFLCCSDNEIRMQPYVMYNAPQQQVPYGPVWNVPYSTVQYPAIHLPNQQTRHFQK